MANSGRYHKNYIFNELQSGPNWFKDFTNLDTKAFKWWHLHDHGFCHYQLYVNRFVKCTISKMETHSHPWFYAQ